VGGDVIRKTVVTNREEARKHLNVLKGKTVDGRRTLQAENGGKRKKSSMAARGSRQC